VNAWIEAAMPHLIIAPILLPLVSAALMLFMGEQQRHWKALINVAASLLGLINAVALLAWVHGNGAPTAIGVYLPANWDVPFGIVLAVDRLTALMLLVTAIVGLAAVLFSSARWHRAGVHFHTLVQIQLMGLNGAFLTADLFNLFVFFEVTLAASYGLLLHGSGRAGVKAGLHYIAVNLLASSFFLVGVAMLYGVTGTLNMADMAQKIPFVPAGDIGLLHAGAAILALAFLIKAAIWPLNFWLVPAYSAASAPVAALFAIMTKVGIYALLRLWTLFFPTDGGGATPFGAEVLVAGGLATLAFGALGVIASQQLRKVAAFSLLVSSGTLLAAIGLNQAALTGGMLFYLLSSTLSISALYLLTELVERAGRPESDELRADDGSQPLPFTVEAAPAPSDANLDDDEEALIGRAIPAAMAFLGLAFMLCVLLIAGLPPMSGFMAKFSMLSALLAGERVAAAGWVLLGLMLVSGLLTTIALSRAGMRHFWTTHAEAPPRLRLIECLPIAALIFVCALCVLRAGPVLHYARAAADDLHQPSGYIDAIMTARPVPGVLRQGAMP
jgi:multicomponent K+:H+ antiporter subunit D